MDLITSIILIVVFIVIQQIVCLVAINKVDKLARERDIYKDRLDNKNYPRESWVKMLRKEVEVLEKDNEELKKQAVRLRNCAEKYGIQLGELEKENKVLNSLINNYEEENPQQVSLEDSFKAKDKIRHAKMKEEYEAFQNEMENK